MTPLVKALLAVALVVPLVAYVAGTLASSRGGAPEQQGTVYLDDAEPVTGTTDETSTRSPQRTPPTPTPSDAPSSPSPSDQGSNSGEVRVVTPAPVGNDDDDDDDERDDDEDDTDDGDDTDD